MTIILHKGKVLDNTYFNSVHRARNYVKMKFPKRVFGEPVMDKLVCKQYGSTYEIVEITFNEDKSY